jgi:hypothetical protein
MRILYGKNYKYRFTSISEEIPDKVKVLDVCCGDAALYSRELKGRVSYVGTDINKNFIKSGKRKFINILPLNVIRDDLPNSDYVIMQASLYQFIPNHKKIVEKLLNSANSKVIICEPIINLSKSKNRLISLIARYSGNPGTGHKTNRFDEKSFKSLFESFFENKIEKFKKIKGGRELMVVLNAK